MLQPITTRSGEAGEIALARIRKELAPLATTKTAEGEPTVFFGINAVCRQLERTEAALELIVLCADAADRVYQHLLTLASQHSTPVCQIDVPIASRKLAKVFGLKKLLALSVKSQSNPEQARKLQEIRSFLTDKRMPGKKRAADADTDGAGAAGVTKKQKAQAAQANANATGGR